MHSNPLTGIYSYNPRTDQPSNLIMVNHPEEVLVQALMRQVERDRSDPSKARAKLADKILYDKEQFMSKDNLPQNQASPRPIGFNALLLLDAFVLGGLVALRLVLQLLESTMDRLIKVEAQAEILNILDHLLPYWLGYMGGIASPRVDNRRSIPVAENQIKCRLAITVNDQVRFTIR